MYTLQILTQSTTEPLTVADLKLHLRLNDTSEDSLLANFITTARMLFEARTGLALVSTTFRQFTSRGNTTYIGGVLPYPQLSIRDQYPYNSAGRIYLMRNPVVAVSQVQYWDANGTQQTANPSTYNVDVVSLPASVWFNSVPSLSYLKAPSLWVDYTTGFTTVPAPIRHAILMYASYLYQHRETEGDSMPDGFKRMTDLYSTNLQGDWGM